MGIIGFLFVIAVIRMWVTYRTDREYAKRGEVPPRYQVKLAQYEAGKRDSAPTRLGASGYFRELWGDVWDDLHGHRTRVREERKAGERPPRRERAKVWWRWLVTPVGERSQAEEPEPEPSTPATPVTAPAPATTPLPPGTWTVGEDGQRKSLAGSATETSTRGMGRRLTSDELKAGAERTLDAELARRVALSPEERAAEEAWRAEANRDHLVTQIQRALDLGAVQGAVSMLDDLKKDHPGYYEKASLTVKGTSFPMAEVHEQARLAEAQLQEEMRADASGCLHEAAQIGVDRGDLIAAVDALDKLKRTDPDYYETGKLTIDGVPVPFADAHERFRRRAQFDGCDANQNGAAMQRTTDQGTGDQPMTAPTGEVINYETHVAELDAQIATAQQQVDSATAFLDSIAKAKSDLDNMQQTYQQAAEAAATKLDHEQALNLDNTTLGHAATVVDALPPNRVNEIYDSLEEMEEAAKTLRDQSETALGSLDAERAHVISEYGEEYTKVAQNLGGDARYLDSGAGTVVTQDSSTAGTQPAGV